jgi:sulfate transport system ATP-binding protein
MEALVERVVYLGFEVRVELVRSDGERLWAQLPRDEAERLELANGQIVYTRPSREQVFSGR